MRIAASARKVGKFGIALVAVGAVLLAMYAAAGFLLVPYLIRAQALPRLSQIIPATLTAERVAFNPFNLTLIAHGLSLRDQAGHELAACRELSAAVAGRDSLAQRRLIVSGQLVGPVLRPALDRRGQLNFAALIPPGKGGGGGTLPFLVTRFAVEDGRLEFRDASRSPAFATAFKDVALSVENLGPEPDREASLDLQAHGENRETVAIHGSFVLAALASQGRFGVAGVNPAPWLDWLAPGSPVEFQGGTLAAQADYALRLDGKPEVAIRAGTAKGENLAVAMRDDKQRWARIGAAEASGLSFSLAERRLALDSAEVRDIATPWLSIAALAAGKLAFGLEEQRFTLDAAELKDMRALGPLESTPSPSAEKSPAATVPRDPPRAARLGGLRVEKLDGSLQQRTISIGAVDSAQAELDLRRLADGRLQVRGLPPLPLQTVETKANTEVSPAPPWRVRIGGLRLDGYSLALLDEAVEPPVRLKLEPARLALTDFGTAPDDGPFHYRLTTGAGEWGRIELDGEARLAPLRTTGHVAVEMLWLRRFKPYWQRHTGVDLTGGMLNLAGDVSLIAEPGLKLDFSGGAELADVSSVDLRERKPLVSWGSLKLEGLTVNSQPRRVGIRTLSAKQPKARVVITKAGGLNLARDLFRAGTEAAGPVEPASAPLGQRADNAWPVDIGTVRIVDGGLDLEDQTLEPSFMVDIRRLNGQVRGLSSRPDARAEIKLDGHINHSTPVTIVGELNPTQFRDHADIVLAFKGLNMTTLSPYSSKFAGYRIEKGKLDLDLRYRLHQGRLEAGNRMVLDQLVLGERVDSPTATTLPVDLAVALMKDSAGKIDLDLPISGRLDNPKFSLRGLYADAFGQLITKLIGSPLTLLASLMGKETEDLGYVTFQPGEAGLTADEQAKLVVLAEALKQRPQLSLDIRGMADRRQDRLVLAERALLEQLKSDRRTELRNQGKRVWDSKEVELAEPDYRRLFAQFYRQSHPDEPESKALAAANKPLLAETDFQRARRKVLEQWAVNETDLRLLAQARGESIRDYLVRRGGLADERIYLLDVRLDEPGDREIKAFLSLSGS
jgi:outer membrane protein OmpA-like peptidoglycan-associated protein